MAQIQRELMGENGRTSFDSVVEARVSADARKDDTESTPRDPRATW